MGLAGVLVVVVGVALALFAGCLARSGRVSMGHGVTWLLVGVLLLLLGFFGAELAGVLGVPAASSYLSFLVIVLLVVLGGLCLYHAAVLSRVQERLKILAQEVALLRADPANPPPARADGSGERDGGAAGGFSSRGGAGR